MGLKATGPAAAAAGAAGCRERPHLGVADRVSARSEVGSMRLHCLQCDLQENLPMCAAGLAIRPLHGVPVVKPGVKPAIPHAQQPATAAAAPASNCGRIRPNHTQPHKNAVRMLHTSRIVSHRAEGRFDVDGSRPDTELAQGGLSCWEPTACGRFGGWEGGAELRAMAEWDRDAASWWGERVGKSGGCARLSSPGVILEAGWWGQETPGRAGCHHSLMMCKHTNQTNKRVCSAWLRSPDVLKAGG